VGTNLTPALLDTILIEMYPNGDALAELAYQKKARPLLSLLKKGSFEGDSMRIPTIIEDSQGLSSTFATAQTNTYPANVTTFTVTPVNVYSVARVTGNAIRQSRGKRYSLVSAIELAMKSGVNGLANALETKLYRTPGGSIGNVDATVTGTTLTMLYQRDINNFAVNMELVFAADESSALRDSGEAVTVTAINRVAGSMTVDTLSNISGLTSGDYIFREGDYSAAGTSSYSLCGLAGWCPASAPSGTLFGVTLTTDTRLGGWRYTGTSVSVEEAIVNGASTMCEGGNATPNTVLISHYDFRTLIAEMGSKVQRSTGPKAEAGFSAIEIHGPTGPMEVIPGPKCPAGHLYILDDSKFELMPCGDVCAILDEDGNTWRAVAAEDTYELRLGFLGNLVCYDTSSICHVTV
jgi:hypothetical protein